METENQIKLKDRRALGYADYIDLYRAETVSKILGGKA
jgi:hypothetical protein